MLCVFFGSCHKSNLLGSNTAPLGTCLESAYGRKSTFRLCSYGNLTYFIFSQVFAVTRWDVNIFLHLPEGLEDYALCSPHSRKGKLVLQRESRDWARPIGRARTLGASAQEASQEGGTPLSEKAGSWPREVLRG